MHLQQKIFAISISILFFIVIIDLVRRRRLREELSWLWLLTGVGVIILAIWYDLLKFITEVIGAVLPTTTLFLFSLIFLMVINLYYATKISSLHDHVKDLAQHIAMLQTKPFNQITGIGA